MMLYSSPTSFHSHRVRLVLAEKNITMDIFSIQGPDLPEDLLDLNPYHSVPTLVDRELVLYDSRVIVEYLDERHAGRTDRRLLGNALLARRRIRDPLVGSNKRYDADD